MSTFDIKKYWAKKNEIIEQNKSGCLYHKCEGCVELYERDVINLIPQGLAAAIYTQVSDVEDETNGLLTYDRQVLKVNPENVKAMSERLYSAFEEVIK